MCALPDRTTSISRCMGGGLNDWNAQSLRHHRHCQEEDEGSLPRQVLEASGRQTPLTRIQRPKRTLGQENPHHPKPAQSLHSSSAIIFSSTTIVQPLPAPRRRRLCDSRCRKLGAPSEVGRQANGKERKSQQASKRSSERSLSSSPFQNQNPNPQREREPGHFF